MKTKAFILFLLLLFCSIVSADIDVNDISIPGDSTLMGMRIKKSYFVENAFLIETTGACFKYVKGELEIYQGLDKTNLRLLSTVTFDDEPNFIKVEATDDHILLWSKDLNLGIYGDSTLIVSPKVKQQLKCRGNFRPDYEGRYKGELLLIDDLGGMEIYPQRYEKGYKLKRIELGKSDWVADYELNSGERVMVAAFPGRAFDWEKSFRTNVITISEGFGPKTPYDIGVLPSETTIKHWSHYFDIIVAFHNSVYKASKPEGPYVIAHEPEFRRLLNTAHKYNMRTVAYVSLFYHYRKFKNIEPFFAAVKKLKDNFEIDGVYIDGLLFDSFVHRVDNKVENWAMLRRLRQLFGSDGIIVLHDTSLGSPVGTVPNIDSYCDATLNGEGVKFRSVDDPYVKYQVRKYGISNTVGLWIPDKKPEYISDKQIVDAIIEMNCRQFWTQYFFRHRSKPDFQYYLKRIDCLKQTWRAEK